MQVYISTWGDPSGWSKVKYIKKNGSDVDSFTVLSAYDDYDKILLLVQDSILVHKPSRNVDIKDCVDKTSDTVLDPFNSLSDPSEAYKNWLGTVKEYTLCSVQKAGVDNDKVTVIVLPGIGKFKGQSVEYHFGVLNVKQKKVPAQPSSNQGAPNMQKKVYLPLSYLESLLAYNLYNELKEMKVEKIVLDITHGINYFASLAQTVATRIASLLNVKLEVIDFIPTEMNAEYMYEKVFSQDRAKFDIENIKELKEGQKKALVLSLQFGSILPIFYICRKRENGMPDYSQTFIGSTRITKEGQNTFSVVTDPIQDLDNSDEVWADLIFNHVCEKLKDIKDQGGYYSLQDLRKMLQETDEGLSNFLSETAVSIINDQLNDIEFRAMNSLSVGEEKMYYSIYPGGRESAEEMLKSKDVTRRNFIAHAGFLKEIIKVKRAGEKEALVKYHFEDEKYNDVLKEIYGFKKEFPISPST